MFQMIGDQGGDHHEIHQTLFEYDKRKTSEDANLISHYRIQYFLMV